MVFLGGRIRGNRIHIYREKMKKFTHFCAIGGVGLFLNLLVAYLITDGLGFWYFWGFLAGVLVNWTFNFLANSLVTFRGHSKQNYSLKYGIFLAIYTCAFAINAGIVYALASIVMVHYLASITAAAIITSLFTFHLAKKFVYSYEKDSSPHS